MKKVISLLFVAVMILALTGCASEGQQLYEKYAGIIDMLETKDYQGAIRDITAMAAQEQQGNVEKTPILQILCDTWYCSYEDAPAQVSFTEDGNCTINGTAMTWLAQGDESETYRWFQLYEDGQLRYMLCLNNESNNVVPTASLYYAEERDGSIYSGDHIGSYYNHPMLPKLLRSWNAISEYEQVAEGVSLNTSEANISGKDYDWSITDDSQQDSLAVHAEGQNDVTGAYTMTLTQRDGHTILYVTDDATGKTGLYYNYEYGYEITWPEYVYPEAIGNLNSYLENGNFWCEISGENYYDRDDNAISYLYDQFVSLGDYADAAEILANWDSVKFSRAMRYLTRFEERSSFEIGETQYGWNLDTLAYIKSQFEEIASYPEAADVLANWNSVLYNRAMYYLQYYYLRNNGFYIGETYYSGRTNAALSYIYSQFAEIADYDKAAEILDRFTIVEDQLLSYNYTSVDHMNNEYKSSTNTLYEYNELGQVVCYSDYGELQRLYGGYSSNAFYTYDDAGRISEIKLGYTNSVDAILTPVYDENGNMVSAHVVNNDGEYDINYTYDDQNRLVEMRRPYVSYDDPEKYYYSYNYTYDAAGDLLKRVYSYVYNGEVQDEYINEYTYDTNGNMVKETSTYNYHDTWNDVITRTYTHVAECICDENGNVIQKNWVYGNTIYSDGDENRADNASATYNYTYGDVYFFDSTGMEIAE